MNGRNRGQQTLTGGVTRKSRERPETYTYCFDCGEPILRGKVRRGEHDDEHTTALDDPYAMKLSGRERRRIAREIHARDKEQQKL